MTPFMLRVAELVGAEPDDHEPPVYRTRLSGPVPANTGADRHVAVRSLAEQLVCEANAVLGEHEHLTLVDDAVPDELRFAVRYADRAAVVTTSFADGVAIGRLVTEGVPTARSGVRPDPGAGGPRELAAPDDVAELIVALIEPARRTA